MTQRKRVIFAIVAMTIASVPVAALSAREVEP